MYYIDSLNQREWLCTVPEMTCFRSLTAPSSSYYIAVPPLVVHVNSYVWLFSACCVAVVFEADLTVSELPWL